MDARRALRVSVLAMAVVAAALIPSVGVAGTPWTIDETPNPGGTYQSHAILATAAISATDAWAVIAAGCTPTTFLHWDGAAWSEVDGPSPGSCRQLRGMAASATDDVWAVGYVPNARGVHRTLIMHWDGDAWTRIPSPNRGDRKVMNDLLAVTAVAADDAWAVGSTWDGRERKTLTLHWNGAAWSIVPSPSPGGGYPGSQLIGVSAIGRRQAWAVGDFHKSVRDPRRTLILRWNGDRWRQVSSPNPGQGPTLLGVSATSRTNAWAVGIYNHVLDDDRLDLRTLIVRWDGEAWRRVTSPNAGTGRRSDWLNGVSATSASNAFAVGEYWTGSANRTLVLRWNGSEWRRMDSPNVQGHWNTLRAVAAVSEDVAFAVGISTSEVAQNQTKDWTLAMHCC